MEMKKALLEGKPVVFGPDPTRDPLLLDCDRRDQVLARIDALRAPVINEKDYSQGYEAMRTRLKRSVSDQEGFILWERELINLTTACAQHILNARELMTGRGVFTEERQLSLEGAADALNEFRIASGLIVVGEGEKTALTERVIETSWKALGAPGELSKPSATCYIRKQDIIKPSW